MIVLLFLGAAAGLATLVIVGESTTTSPDQAVATLIAAVLVGCIAFGEPLTAALASTANLGLLAATVHDRRRAT